MLSNQKMGWAKKGYFLLTQFPNFIGLPKKTLKTFDTIFANFTSDLDSEYLKFNTWKFRVSNISFNYSDQTIPVTRCYLCDINFETSYEIRMHLMTKLHKDVKSRVWSAWAITKLTTDFKKVANSLKVDELLRLQNIFLYNISLQNQTELQSIYKILKIWQWQLFIYFYRKAF